MAVDTVPFFDPQMLQQQRGLLLSQVQGVADLNLQSERVQEDRNIFRPYLERRFGKQAESLAENFASRGFHGRNQGPLKQALAELSEHQVFQRGNYEREAGRTLTDIQRAIANLTGSNILEGAENVRLGAGRASGRAYPIGSMIDNMPRY